jgi:hypothetical protein
MVTKIVHSTTRHLDVDQEMAMIEKGQQLVGHFPDADALGRARRVLEGTLSEADAYAELAAALDRDDRDDRDETLRLFMRLAGSSEDDIAGAASSTFWPPLRALAPTLRYDAACLGDGAPPAARLATIAQPVLLTTGVTIDPHSAGLPIDFFGAAADATADHLPDARRATIEAAGHVADPALLGPMLAAFYAADMSTTRPTVTSP